MLYLIYCQDAPGTHETRRSVRNAHLKHLQTLVDQKRLLIAGPWYEPDGNRPFLHHKGWLIVAEFADIEAAKAWAAADPYATAEVFARVTISPFKQVLP